MRDRKSKDKIVAIAVKNFASLHPTVRSEKKKKVLKRVGFEPTPTNRPRP